jgi:hypothetical protein
MALVHSPRIITDGLVLAFDAANSKSYDNYENLLRQSQALATSPWSIFSGIVGGFTVSNNVTTSPDGTSNASQINSTTLTSGDSVYQDVSVSGSGTYTLSIFVKGGASSSITFAAFFTGNSTQGFSFVFNPLTGQVTSGSGIVISYPNGWYRIYFTVTGTNGSNNTLRFQIYSNTTGITYLWGAQLERGGIASPYFATTTTSKSRGVTWIDLSGNTRNATLVSFPNYSTDGLGSILFNSTSSYVTLTTNSYGITDAYTVSFWVKRIGGTGVFLYIGQTGSAGMYFESYANTDLFTWFFGPSSPQNSESWGSNPLSTTSWTHVGMTMVTSTKTQTKYINGAVSGSPFVFTNAVTAPSSSGTWQIKNNSQNWTGYISNLQIYNRALTAAEIQQNFNAHRGRFGI